ncbi:unnamed protein product [Agarophyton chilense]
MPSTKNQFNLCTEGHTQYSCYSSLLSLAESRQEERNIILLVVTNTTRHLVLNWCISINRVHLQNYILVALDSASYIFFADLNAPVVTIPNAPSPVSRSEVWIRRTLLTSVLLLNDFNVLISDADAIAVRSPFSSPIFKSYYPSFDIIASPSNFPNPLRNELPKDCIAVSKTPWRHQPCMGWIFIRSNAKTNRFFSKLFIPNVLKYGDDQIGLVCALQYAGESWKDPHPWSWTDSTIIQFRNPALRMLMLPATRYVRNCTKFKQDKLRNYGIWKFDFNNVAMFHCKGPDKRANAENNDVWYLRERWSEEKTSPNLPFKAYLHKITRKRYIEVKDNNLPYS